MRHIHLTAMRLPLFLRVVAMYVFLAAPIWAFASIQPEPLAAAHTVNTVKKIKYTISPPQLADIRSGQPAIISIPKLGIELPVIDGKYDQPSDSWTLSDDKVQYATMTSQPNNRTGNTFMYGHNTDAVFKPLARLQTGDEVIIRTVNGLSFKYTLNTQALVAPDATEILAPTGGPSLTLMTCEGIFDEARRVAIFDFEKVL